MSLLNDFLELSGHNKQSQNVATDYVTQLALNAGCTDEGIDKVLGSANFSKLKDISQKILIDAAADKKNNKREELVETLTYLPDMVQFLNTRAGRNFVKLYRTVTGMTRDVALEWATQASELEALKASVRPPFPLRAPTSPKKESSEPAGTDDETTKPAPFGKAPITNPFLGTTKPAFMVFGPPEFLEQFRKMFEEGLGEEGFGEEGPGF